MLHEPAGATMASLVAATDWKKPSVRGFLAAVVRRKLRLDLSSELGVGGRIYRIRNEPDAERRDF
jgi:hypothetical protein